MANKNPLSSTVQFYHFTKHPIHTSKDVLLLPNLRQFSQFSWNDVKKLFVDVYGAVPLSMSGFSKNSTVALKHQFHKRRANFSFAACFPKPLDNEKFFKWFLIVDQNIPADSSRAALFVKLSWSPQSLQRLRSLFWAHWYSVEQNWWPELFTLGLRSLVSYSSYHYTKVLLFHCSYSACRTTSCLVEIAMDVLTYGRLVGGRVDCESYAETTLQAQTCRQFRLTNVRVFTIVENPREVYVIYCHQ